MTVIVYRDSVLASDTALWQGGLIVGYRNKIRRLNDERLYAAGGPSDYVQIVGNWLDYQLDGPPPPLADPSDYFGAIVVDPKIRSVFKIGRQLVLHNCDFLPYVVEGAHAEFLLGALAQGASAEEAVALAIRYGDSAGGEVQVERI